MRIRTQNIASYTRVYKNTRVYIKIKTHACMNTLLRVHACTFQFTHTFVATAPPTPHMSHACDTRGLFKLWVICTVHGNWYMKHIDVAVGPVGWTNNLVGRETTIYVQSIANMIHHFCLANHLFTAMPLKQYYSEHYNGDVQEDQVPNLEN